MARVMVLTCDRCGKQEADGAGGRSLKAEVPGTELVQQFDVCLRCYNSLMTWFERPPEVVRAIVE